MTTIVLDNCEERGQGLEQYYRFHIAIFSNDHILYCNIFNNILSEQYSKHPWSSEKYYIVKSRDKLLLLNSVVFLGD